jgi:hypothetical protein
MGRLTRLPPITSTDQKQASKLRPNNPKFTPYTD